MESDRVGWTRAPGAAWPLVLVAAVLLWPTPAVAQRFTAELSGTVVDEVGGALPGARVTLVQEASRSSRHVVTNDHGFFTFSAVPAATYTLTIELQGFASHELTDIVLRAGDSRTVRQIPLKLAARAETVSVSAEIERTPLNSGEKSVTLGEQVIEEIPLVSSNAGELLRLLPGMTPRSEGAENRPAFTGEVIGINGSGEAAPFGQSPFGNYSANGSPVGVFDLTIDGAPATDPGGTASSVNPNTEMVQEFKVLQSSYGAEHAKGPASMTVVSRSGGRDLHGSGFLYFRDYHLNSNDWYANKVGDERVKSRYVYPGFTLSGPVSLGGFNGERDKLFFFVGYEHYFQRLDVGYSRSWVPTAQMRQGDFRNAAAVGSGAFVNTPPVFFGTPMPVVPPSLFDPGGQVLLDRFPLPNADPATTGGYNFVENLLVDQPNSQLMARLDWNLSPSTKAFLRYNRQRETQPFAFGMWWRAGQRQVPSPSPILGHNRSDSVTVSLTHVFDPTLTSETLVAVTYIDFQNAFEDPAQLSRSALGYPYQGVFGDSFDVIPSVDAGGAGDAGPALGSLLQGFQPDLFATKWQYSLAENVTRVWGTHTVKFGFFWERTTNTQPGSGLNNGFIVLAPWSPLNTGNTFADLLLGQTGWYGEQSANVLHDVGWSRWELWAQDSWRVSPRVTLSYGARASLFEGVDDLQGNGLVAWDESRYASDVASGLDFPGVTWTARDPRVPLSGVGSALALQPRLGFAWDVRGDGATVLRGGGGLYLWRESTASYGDYVDLGAGVRYWEQYLVRLDQVEGLNPDDLAFGSTALDITDDRVPRSWNWSLTLNQRLPWSMSLELGYVGNRIERLANGGATTADRNAPPLGAMLEDPLGDPNAYRPLQAYGPLAVRQASLFSSYNGMQALLTRQRGDFNFSLAWTFSKVLGIQKESGSEYILVPYRDYAYGPLGDDRTHVATGSFSWLLPGTASDGVVGALLDGWQLSGVVNYVSGAPLPYVGGSPNFNIQGTNAEGVDLVNQNNITGTPAAPVMPVLMCDPRENVPGGYLFNPTCFAAPSPGQNGNYNLPYLKGQSYWNVDLALFKNFDLGGDRKLQLRLSAFNVLNHPIAYPDPTRNLTLNFDRGAVLAGFGWLPTEDHPELGGANKAGRRIVQLALRFIF
ncbi:MAG: carboxypeptidase-like regulatory domain-containing protein [Acidobacteria bacterium]|nr:carboxypeptidase-like regulatory domain-containing protein [Acidobacteriota bacterium]